MAGMANNDPWSFVRVPDPDADIRTQVAPSLWPHRANTIKGSRRNGTYGLELELDAHGHVRFAAIPGGADGERFLLVCSHCGEPRWYRPFEDFDIDDLPDECRIAFARDQGWGECRGRCSVHPGGGFFYEKSRCKGSMRVASRDECRPKPPPLSAYWAAARNRFEEQLWAVPNVETFEVGGTSETATAYQIRKDQENSRNLARSLGRGLDRTLGLEPGSVRVDPYHAAEDAAAARLLERDRAHINYASPRHRMPTHFRGLCSTDTPPPRGFVGSERSFLTPFTDCHGVTDHAKALAGVPAWYEGGGELPEPVQVWYHNVRVSNRPGFEDESLALAVARYDAILAPFVNSSRRIERVVPALTLRELGSWEFRGMTAEQRCPKIGDVILSARETVLEPLAAA